MYLEVPCNPNENSCFVESCEDRGEVNCEGESNRYYKFIYKKAYLFPDCDPSLLNCPIPSCDDDSTCSEVECSVDDQESGVSCSGSF